MVSYPENFHPWFVSIFFYRNNFPSWYERIFSKEKVLISVWLEFFKIKKPPICGYENTLCRQNFHPWNVRIFFSILWFSSSISVLKKKHFNVEKASIPGLWEFFLAPWAVRIFPKDKKTFLQNKPLSLACKILLCRKIFHPWAVSIFPIEKKVPWLLVGNFIRKKWLNE